MVIMQDVYCVIKIFFFFKQKTAYEMRISDWSSDVCSSDLVRHRRPAGLSASAASVVGAMALPVFHASSTAGPLRAGKRGWQRPKFVHQSGLRMGFERLPAKRSCAVTGLAPARRDEHWRRSEEHTSELQSLMRNSYAVFCLKK